MKPRLPTQREQQRGAATLVVVMVLFLIMALLAAYANRSLVFEQRIANGYYRASLAQEMAEGPALDAEAEELARQQGWR